MRKLSLLIVLAVSLAIASTALAGGVTVTTSPNPTTVGSTFDVEICGLGGRTAEYLITAPDNSTTSGQIYAPNCGTIHVLADQSGDYTIEVFNKNGSHLLASATETAV